ncbi:MAG TPA: Rrf2 family transcriptional regulator [Ignavibacteriaceae bacterium]|nr:Rrf2 family transcriptional regulator [Ignavibacteriaceae bacterium]
MKFSSQEEYGLRCLLRIGKAEPNGLTIPEISEMEGLSVAHVGKLLRILRIGKFIESERGQNGGYKLARQADKILISEVLAVLGGRLFEASFCQDHSGAASICTNSIDCSVRSLWSNIQDMLDNVLSKITLKDMLGKEETVSILVSNFTDEAGEKILSN